MTNLVNLLLIEREHNAQWWAVLNELRTNRQLPEWLTVRTAGTAADHDNYLAAQCKTNRAIFGTELVLPGDSLQVVGCNEQALIDTIEAERDFPLRWWTWLNEARLRKQLPDWALQMSVGHVPDIERWRSTTEAVNLALFGTDYVRGSTTVAKAGAQRLRAALT